MIKIQERIMIMYTLQQTTNILMDAVERCNWENVGFERSPQEVAIRFSDNFIDDESHIGWNAFSATKFNYYYYDGKELNELREELFFEGIDKYLWMVCGIHLDMNAADRETAACGD